MVESIKNMATPDRKVQVGAGMGGLSAIIIWALNALVLGEADQIPAEVGIGFSTFMTFVVQYFVPNP